MCLKKSCKVCFLNTQNEFLWYCNESRHHCWHHCSNPVHMTECFSLTPVLKITLKIMYFLPSSCGPAVFCPKTQNMSLIFYLLCFTSDWNIYFPCFYIMLRSYATDFTVLMMYMTLVKQHCRRKYLIFLIMNLLPCFSCDLSPTSCFLSTGCLSKLHGNRKWWEIVLVLLFCGKQLWTWCLYLVPFLVIKIHFKTIIILVVHLKLFGQSVLWIDFK